MTEAILTPETPVPTPHRHWYRLALGATILLVVTHSAELAKRFPTRFTIADGRLA